MSINILNDISKKTTVLKNKSICVNDELVLTKNKVRVQTKYKSKGVRPTTTTTKKTVLCTLLNFISFGLALNFRLCFMLIGE